MPASTPPLQAPSCKQCTNPGPTRVHYPEGKGQETVRNGAVRTAEYTSIRVPLLGLFAKSVKSSTLTGVAANVASGKPTRPCIVTKAKRQEVCLLCSFDGDPPPDLLREFLVPVFPTVAQSPQAGHVHSVPEWSHKYDQWILAVPFRPRVDDVQDLPLWRSDLLPDGVHFDRVNLDLLHELSADISRAWSLRVETDPAFVRQVEKFLVSWKDSMTTGRADSCQTRQTKHPRRPPSQYTTRSSLANPFNLSAMVDSVMSSAASGVRSVASLGGGSIYKHANPRPKPSSFPTKPGSQIPVGA